MSNKGNLIPKIQESSSRISFGSFMKSCVKKKSKLEIEQEKLKERERKYKIAQGMMEEESLPGNRDTVAATSVKDIQISNLSSMDDSDSEQDDVVNLQDTNYSKKSIV
jgi:hypothetical protein